MQLRPPVVSPVTNASARLFMIKESSLGWRRACQEEARPPARKEIYGQEGCFQESRGQEARQEIFRKESFSEEGLVELTAAVD